VFRLDSPDDVGADRAQLGLAGAGHKDGEQRPGVREQETLLATPELLRSRLVAGWSETTFQVLPYYLADLPRC
jgi:hypothetical protein